MLPTYGGITGWAQLRWAGASWFDGLANDGRTPRAVPLAVPLGDLRSQPGIQIWAEHLDEDELEWLDGLRTTRSVRSLLFEIRMAPSLLAAVVAIDMAAHSDLVSIAELVAFIRDHVGWPGIRQARAACDLADENSWSPREVWLRFVWMCEAGFPRPSMNTPVFDLAGRHVGTPDLLDVEAGAVGEYEGADFHLNPESRHRDLGREDAFRAIGLEYFTMVSRDAAHRSALVARMTAARASRQVAAAGPAAMDRHTAGLVGTHRHRRAASRAHPRATTPLVGTPSVTQTMMIALAVVLSVTDGDGSRAGGSGGRRSRRPRPDRPWGTSTPRPSGWSGPCPSVRRRGGG